MDALERAIKHLAADASRYLTDKDIEILKKDYPQRNITYIMDLKYIPKLNEFAKAITG